MGCKTHTTAAEPVKDEKSFDHKLPNLKFIDEFDPITFEAPKGRQSMLDEPFISETDGTITDKVTGFLRRENNYGVSGWYIISYEEDYENKIKVPKKQEIPVEYKLSTINEDISNTLHEDEELMTKLNHISEIEKIKAKVKKMEMKTMLKNKTKR
ncbi:hypothetical protein YYG_01641 [Plasmodium vinckei petteri]|uniref:Erythrocyte membrane antigen 1 n=1 Tax=Plasmodium vinckei petteri TaxID=138298 RepID=W7AP06_PLAVN|nr:hypothetical protein YYG_01641 [Plasmodium vinckei petteri]